ncbi:methylmalonyl Co-A mutase-associated GTPase MeaB [Dongia sp.]|uniref:methylmalonyl Co-A mutase-associated GTPase MeaB n=1 Tax=Dongia sp. TaxID=1977262 RepID=UPI0035B4D6C2
MNAATGSTIKHHAAQIVAGDRRALARAITLIESTRADHRRQAEALIEELLPHSGRSLRIGISGPPGVGKSTFIEAFGQHAIGEGRRLAVLAVDPSSRLSGGSILGDKTRMEALSRSEAAFIRPSPAGLTLGGVARRTREALLVCEAAGFDLIIVETVGVGQSETAVAEMVDLFLVLLLPGGGDDLQGIKRGIMELADILVVNKADGDLKMAADRAAADVANALGLMQPRHAGWRAEVLRTSALKQTGIAEVWVKALAFEETLKGSGAFDAQRRDQAKAWLWHELSDSLIEALKADPHVAAKLGNLEAKVGAGKMAPGTAAQELLASFLNR